MKRNESPSKLLMIAAVFKKFSSKAEGKTPEETEKSLRQMVIECAGDVYDALVHILVHPTAADLAFLTTEANVAFAVVAAVVDMDKDNDSVVYKAKMLAIEGSIQRYLYFKAAGLPGGKTGNKDLLSLIEANMPEKPKVEKKAPVAEASAPKPAKRKYVKKAVSKKSAKKAAKK